MLGPRLKQLRLQKGLTQAKLATAAGLYPTTISRIEREVVEPDLATLEAIADALQVSIADLLAEPEPATDPAPQPEQVQAGKAVGQ